MIDINIYKIPENTGKFSIAVSQKSRGWMNENPHSYRCVPLSIANTYGWDILLPEAIELEWNGGKEKNDVKVLKGKCFKPHFGSGTVTLEGSYSWQTTEDVQIMVMPIPNADQYDLVSLTAIVETDRLQYPWFLTCQLTHPGKYKFESGTPLARIIPIRIKDVINSSISIQSEPKEYAEYRAWQAESRNEFEKNKKGKFWQQFYHKVARYTSIKAPKVGRK